MAFGIILTLYDVCVCVSVSVTVCVCVCVCEVGPDTDHDNLYRGQDKSKNVPKRPQNAPPEGEEHMIRMQDYIKSRNIRPREVHFEAVS